MGSSCKSGFRPKRKHTVINNRQHYSRRPSSKSRTSVDYVGWGLGDNEVAFRSESLPSLGGGGGGGSDREVGVARASSN